MTRVRTALILLLVVAVLFGSEAPVFAHETGADGRAPDPAGTFPEPYARGQVAGFESVAGLPEKKLRVIVQVPEATEDGSQTGYGEFRSMDPGKALRAEAFHSIQNAGILVRLVAEFDGQVFNGFVLEVRSGDLNRLEGAVRPARVYPDLTVHANLTESSALIGAPQVWALADSAGQAASGQGVIVAIVDTGIDYRHGDLGGCLGTGCRVIGGYDFVNNDTDPMDDHGHGTHVAGIVAASGGVKGVAPGSRLLAYKVLGASGSGWLSDVIAGIDRAVKDGADIINLSLGASGTPDDPVSQAVDRAVENGAFVVVAAGNSGRNGYATLDSPGVARRAFTVGATDKADRLAGFTGLGPVAYPFNLNKPDVVAPGVDIVSTTLSGDPRGYTTLSGTSMAAPHVSGAAALLLQLYPEWSPEQLRSALANTASDTGLILPAQGAGRVQVDLAATVPLLASPSSIAFGLPRLDGDRSAAIRLTNISGRTLTVTPTVGVRRVLLDAKNSLAEPEEMPAGYALLDRGVFPVGPGESTEVILSLNLPDLAPAGYYEGELSLTTWDGAAAAELHVPFTFWLVTPVELALIDRTGGWIGSGADVHLGAVRLSDQKAIPLASGSFPGSLTTGLPEGEYVFYAVTNPGKYIHLVAGYSVPPPLVIFQKETIGRDAPVEIWLDGREARPVSIDTRDRHGRPAFLGKYRLGFRYQGTNITDFGYDNFYNILSEQSPRTVPAAFEIYVRSLPGMELMLSAAGFGFSPELLSFATLNAKRWMAGTGDTFGILYQAWADEVYVFTEKISTLEVLHTVRAYQPEGTRRYRVRYDYPGVPRETGLLTQKSGCELIGLPEQRAYGFKLLLGNAAGVTRWLYARGPFYLTYQADCTNPATEYSFEDIEPAWGGNAIPDGTASGGIRYRDSGWEWEARAQVHGHELRLGSAVTFPAARFDNQDAAIRVHAPLFSSANGTAYIGQSPEISIYRDEVQIEHVEADTIHDTWRPSTFRYWEGVQPGSYRISAVQYRPDDPLQVQTWAEARFSLPAADPNPPYIIGLDLPQRYLPGAPFSITLRAGDAESGLAEAALAYRQEGGDWINLAASAQDGSYSAVLHPGTAGAVDLRVVVSDRAGNQIAFETYRFARAEIPARLSMSAAPNAQVNTVRLSGRLEDEAGNLITGFAFPIQMYVGERLAGYVLSAVKTGGQSYQNGMVEFDWTFDPVIFDHSGERSVRFVLDTGLIQRQEVVVDLSGVPMVRRTFFPIIGR